MTTCWLCGDALRRVARVDTDEFVWVDPDGKQTGTDSDLRHWDNPYAHLAWLGDELERAVRQRGKKSEPTWLYWRHATEYGALKVRLEIGGTFHVHQAGESEPFAGDVPECCGWPMWLRPSGWQCRQCKAKSPAEAGRIAA